jgi:hypothetical protein
MGPSILPLEVMCPKHCQPLHAVLMHKQQMGPQTQQEHQHVRPPAMLKHMAGN